MGDEAAVRIVTRVTDMLAVPPPGSRVFPCSRCASPSWLAPDSDVRDVRVCVRCALADPDLRPGVLATARAVQSLGDVLPPAFGPGERRG